jgi:hypothetical protein
MDETLTIEQRWSKLETSLNQVRSSIAERKGARDQLLKNKAAEEQALGHLLEEQRLSEQASLFLAAEIVERRQKATSAIESIGTSALKMIYGDDYALIFETFNEKREKGEKGGFKMEIQIKSDLKNQPLKTGLMGERGGGVIEVTAFGLRIAALDWMGYDGPLILDEAWKSMSADSKIEAVANFLKFYSDSTKRQIIFATHRADVFGKHANNIVRIKKENGVASASRMNYEEILEEAVALANRGDDAEIVFFANGTTPPPGMMMVATSDLSTEEISTVVKTGKLPRKTAESKTKK